MPLQESCHFQRVFRMLSLPERQRLQPLEKQKCVERAQTGPDIAKQLHPCLDDEGDVSHTGKVPEDLPEFQAVIARVRFGELGEFAVSPVEFSGIDDDAADGGAVTADELRRRCGQDVGPVVDRFHEAHADRVVHDEGDPRLMGDLRRSPQNRGHPAWGCRSSRHRRPASSP